MRERPRFWQDWKIFRCREGHILIDRLYYSPAQGGGLHIHNQVIFHSTWPWFHQRKHRGNMRELADSEPKTILAAMNDMLKSDTVDWARAKWWFVAAEDGTRLSLSHDSPTEPALIPAAPALVGWSEWSWRCWS